MVHVKHIGSIREGSLERMQQPAASGEEDPLEWVAAGLLDDVHPGAAAPEQIVSSTRDRR